MRQKQQISLAALARFYPDGLFDLLPEIAGCRGQCVYLVGGVLRDWLRRVAVVPPDLDVAVQCDAAGFLRRLARRLGSGTVVVLGDPADDTCRLVLPELVIDAAGFRDGATEIAKDLVKRDFTINAMAVDLAAKDGHGQAPLIDPLGGKQDIENGIIRSCPGAFVADPLRLLRAIRLAAELDFVIEDETLAEIGAVAHLITSSAAERINAEWERIMATPRAASACAAMDSCGLLAEVAPELMHGDGVGQPACHHLDVLDHNIETLRCLERVIDTPAEFFPESSGSLVDYLAEPSHRMQLKWAALFHDVGKPTAKALRPDAGSCEPRITFYGHDERGGEIFLRRAERLHWNRRRAQRVAELIAMHMHPFHLCNVARRDGEVSRRALLKICRRAGDDLAGLFVLAMADTLAGQGTDRPATIETELAGLYARVDRLYHETIAPVLNGPKLLTGNDLIATLRLEPGPLFRELLEGVETAVVEGVVHTREEALGWVDRYLAEREHEMSGRTGARSGPERTRSGHKG
ncbi:poly(A) polymerase [Desulfofustis glycolicus DSM 9705]|uniref:Poly(A) polymerase n=1 Tax=Desulfofustis glycolicus DSM 9705 TaxID=1121409 RepID=A0A1M5XX03_9BACT|nr:poly(A) polymerase [Desulfofustis glycolicus DSM 9705]